MVVKAQYNINYYLVVYLDYNGTVLKRSDIAYGTTAVAPANPSREGYVFMGWSPDYNIIEEETYFVAQYEAEKPEGIKVTYIDYDDSILSIEEIVLHIPETPNHQDRECIGWYAVNTNIEEGLVIQAIYKDDAQNVSSPISDEQTHKMIDNGQILILRGDKVYTVTGQQVK